MSTANVMVILMVCANQKYTKIVTVIGWLGLSILILCGVLDFISTYYWLVGRIHNSHVYIAAVRLGMALVIFCGIYMSLGGKLHEKCKSSNKNKNN